MHVSTCVCVSVLSDVIVRLVWSGYSYCRTGSSGFRRAAAAGSGKSKKRCERGHTSYCTYMLLTHFNAQATTRTTVNARPLVYLSCLYIEINRHDRIGRVENIRINAYCTVSICTCLLFMVVWLSLSMLLRYLLSKSNSII